MVHFGLPFDEVVIGLQQPDTQQRLLAFSPTAKAPVLIDSGNIIWDSLAILEYLAETHAEAPIWPKDRAARAHARVLSAEMHSSFQALRQACPMNFRRARRKIDVSSQVVADVVRIEAAWADARTRFGSGGPFLFGAFCAADAMFAPVINRLDVYDFDLTPVTRAYIGAMKALPAWQQWDRDAQAEGMNIASYDAI